MTYPPPPPCPPCPPGEFYSECIVVCDRYYDFLGKTLPHNKYHFNRIIVITSPEDKETQRICEYWHVECLPTDSLQSRWGKFCKGCAINFALAKLSKKQWVVQMDADILLPPQTRLILERACLDERFIYGIDRFNVKGFKNYADFIDMPALQHEDNTFVHTQAFPIGTRIQYPGSGGYLPLGFFQMWDPKVSGHSKYPEIPTTAGKTDTMFAAQWPRRERALIPEIIGYHLESDDATMGGNWKGRVSSPFTHDLNPKQVKSPV